MRHPRRPERPRPWSGPARPTCPRCGRPAYPVPAGGRVHWLAIWACAGGWTFGPHVCLPAGARYPMRVVMERAPMDCEMERLFGES